MSSQWMANPLTFVILNEVKNHYVGVCAKQTDSSLRSE